MVNRTAKLAAPAAASAEALGLAYFTEAGVAALAAQAARKTAKPTALDQMFAYYTAE